MGARLLTKNEILHVHDQSRKRVIQLANWRAIREHDRHGTDGLYIILPSFRMYFIPGMTMEQFHNHNHQNDILDVPYEYIKNVLSCEKCNGEGKLDWVEVTRGKPQQQYHHGYGEGYTYTRHRRGIVHMINVGWGPKIKPYHISTAFLRKGEEHCNVCSGTGLLMAEEGLIKESYKLEKS